MFCLYLVEEKENRKMFPHVNPDCLLVHLHWSKHLDEGGTSLVGLEGQQNACRSLSNQ